MKVLNSKQFGQTKSHPVGLDGKWRDSLGEVEYPFWAIVYGLSSNGKTRFTVQLIKKLSDYGVVEYYSYEERHGSTLRRAMHETGFDDTKYPVRWIDPIVDTKKGKNEKSHVQRLDERLSKRGGAKFIVIDSVDYTNMKLAEYKALREKHYKKKVLIFISHAEGKRPATWVGKKIEYDVDIKIRVDKYIAYASGRFSGKAPYIVWEDKAKELNPLYFQKLAQQDGTVPKKKRGRKPKQLV